jgi:branched-chain amino acid transport system permease protein
MGDVLQVVLTGLASGALIGLVALGFTLVAGTVRVLHLAHGDVVIASVLIGVLAVVGTTPVSARLGLTSSLALVAWALASGVVLSTLIYLVLIRPAAGNPLAWVAGGVAAGLLARAVLGAALPQEGYAVPDPLRLDALTSTGVVTLPGDVTVSARSLGVLGLGLLLGTLAQHLLRRGRWGLALRAVADDDDAAALCGIDVSRVVLRAFVVAGLLAGVAGLLAAPGGSTSVDDGVVLGLEGVAAALLGGLGSLRGAIVGGLAVGLVQSLAVWAAGAAMQDVAPLGLLVLLLAIRPQGLRRVVPA